MQSKSIVFDKALSASLTEVKLDERLATHEVLLQTEYSLVSQGTELAIYRGLESWAPLPFSPGYAAVGKVLAVGADAGKIRPGDRLFCYCGHRQFSKADVNHAVVVLGSEVDARHAVFARMAAVSMTALRVAEVELGDWVVVFGLGLVGNLAAQLFALSGARVIGVDLSEKRLDTARGCGLEWLINSARQDVSAELKRLTGGRGASTVVEATGSPQVAEQALGCVAPRGEMILLGTPRGKYHSDLTDFLRRIHIWDFGCPTLKGAHEWRFPMHAAGGEKHSIAGHCQLLVDLIARQKLRIAPLISHCTSPGNAQAVYQGMLAGREDYMGVLFDWRGEAAVGAAAR